VNKIVIIFRKIKTLITLEKELFFLLPEVFVFIFWSQLNLSFYSFEKLSNSFGSLMKESPIESNNRFPKQILNISVAINLIANNLPWQTTCYPRAICGKWMLNRRNMESTLYLGVMKSDDAATKGHAWLRCGKRIVTGELGHKKYQIIAYYS